MDTVEITPEQIAEEVGEWHHNDSMKGYLKLYIEAIQRAGFKIVKES